MKVSIQNCQNWVAQLVAELVNVNIFPESANQVVHDAPRNWSKCPGCFTVRNDSYASPLAIEWLYSIESPCFAASLRLSISKDLNDQMTNIYFVPCVTSRSTRLGTGFLDSSVSFSLSFLWPFSQSIWGPYRWGPLGDQPRYLYASIRSNYLCSLSHDLSRFY